MLREWATSGHRPGSGALKQVCAIIDSMTPGSDRTRRSSAGAGRNGSRGLGAFRAEINRLSQAICSNEAVMKSVQAAQSGRKRGLRLPFLDGRL